MSRKILLESRTIPPPNKKAFWNPKKILSRSWKSFKYPEKSFWNAFAKCKRILNNSFEWSGKLNWNVQETSIIWLDLPHFTVWNRRCLYHRNPLKCREIEKLWTVWLHLIDLFSSGLRTGEIYGNSTQLLLNWEQVYQISVISSNFPLEMKRICGFPIQLSSDWGRIHRISLILSNFFDKDEPNLWNANSIIVEPRAN